MSAKRRIIESLKLQGKTQQSLAKALNLSRGAVSDMLKSDGDPPIKYLEATSMITGVAVEWLRSGKGPRLASEAKSEPKNALSIVEDYKEEYLRENKITINTMLELIQTQKKTIELLQTEHERLRAENEKLKEEKKSKRV